MSKSCFLSWFQWVPSKSQKSLADPLDGPSMLMCHFGCTWIGLLHGQIYDLYRLGPRADGLLSWNIMKQDTSAKTHPFVHASKFRIPWRGKRVYGPTYGLWNSFALCFAPPSPPIVDSPQDSNYAACEVSPGWVDLWFYRPIHNWGHDMWLLLIWCSDTNYIEYHRIIGQSQNPLRYMTNGRKLNGQTWSKCLYLTTPGCCSCCASWSFPARHVQSWVSRQPKRSDADETGRQCWWRVNPTLRSTTLRYV